MKILALESSTTSAKAMYYDTQTKTYDVESHAYILEDEDVTVHDAEKVFAQTMALGKKLCAGRDVDIISLGGTWHSLMLCDHNMKPTTPVYLWSNMKASEICKQIRKDTVASNAFYQKTGCVVNAIYPVFKIKLFREMGYDVDHSLLLGQGTYNTYGLTGKRVVAVSVASGSGLMNTHQQIYDDSILEENGISKEQLPEIVTYDQTFPLTEEGARLLGLQVGIPVMPTNSDGGLNQIGAGAMEDGVMTFSVGTSGAIRLTTSKPIIPETPSLWCYRSPKAWLSGAAVSGCTNCIDWFKKSFFDKGVSYEDMEKNCKNPLDTPIFLPFLFGERSPGWDDEKTGSFFDVKPIHTRYDMYRGIQEGILFALYDCYKKLADVNGVPKRIMISGGIIYSELWLQMCADIFQQELHIDECEHSSLMGGIALGLEVLGEIQDVGEFYEPPTKSIKPNLDMKEIYDRKFERYRHWYDKIQ